MTVSSSPVNVLLGESHSAGAQGSPSFLFPYCGDGGPILDLVLSVLHGS